MDNLFNKIESKLFEDANGYIYRDGKGYRVFWKNEKYKPHIDLLFSYINEAYFYLRSVN